jgi:hypothetical protein
MQREELKFSIQTRASVGDAEAVTGLAHNAMTVRRPANKADHLRFLIREASAVDIVILSTRTGPRGRVLPFQSVAVPPRRLRLIMFCRPLRRSSGLGGSPLPAERLIGCQV